jgi:hypothetical protein
MHDDASAVRQPSNVYYRELEEHLYCTLVVWAKRVLDLHGWSQNEWARRAGVPQACVSRMLNPGLADLPTLKTIIKLGETAGFMPNLMRRGTITNIRSKRYARTALSKKERNAHKTSPQRRPA